MLNPLKETKLNGLVNLDNGLHEARMGLRLVEAEVVA